MNEPCDVLAFDQDPVLALLDDLWNAAVSRSHDWLTGCSRFNSDQSERLAAAGRHNDHIGGAVDVFHIRAIANIPDSRIFTYLAAQAFLGIRTRELFGVAAFADDQELDRRPRNRVRHSDEQVDSLDIADLAHEADHDIVRRKIQLIADVAGLIESREYDGIVHNGFRHRLRLGRLGRVGGYRNDQVRVFDERSWLVDDHMIMGDDRDAQQLRRENFGSAPIVCPVDVQQIDAALMK